MKLLIFVLVVFVANIVSVTAAFKCHTCDNCADISGAKDADNCDFCKTTNDVANKQVKRECVPTGGKCDNAAGPPAVTCCNTEKCNSVDFKVTTATKFSCYECTGCANPFQKDTGKKLTNCEACKTTTTKADKKINKACIATAAECKPTTDDTAVVECCTTDLCNAGISHSIKKSVLVGLLALAIGAICY